MKTVTFKYEPSKDSSVDPEFQVVCEGQVTQVTIQVAIRYGAGYAINEHGYDRAGDPTSFWVRQIAHRETMAEAKAVARAYVRQ